MLTVHLRIIDSATKKSLPVRLRISDDTGKEYAPLGRLSIFACGRGEDVGGSIRLGRENLTHIDGACEIALPASVPLRIQAFHGPEWEPLDRTTTLGPGQMALRFELNRWCDWKAEGWTRTDTRCQFITPHAALLEAAAEDVDTVNLLASVHRFLAHDGNTYPTLPNLAAFSGQVPALAADGREVIVNTYNTHPSLGKLGLLNSHRVVYPLAFGGAEGPDDWSLCDWADQCHRKNGKVVWCEPFRDGLPGGEALVALILGKIDAIEYDPQPRSRPFLPWLYHLWNAGFAVPLVGGSGKQSNRIPIGAVRTYSKLTEPIGQSFITNGPLIRFTVEPHRALASAESITPFDKLEVVSNGRVIASAPAVPTVRYSAAVEVPQPERGWISARVVGGTGAMLNPALPAFAHTSVTVVGEPLHQSKSIQVLRNCVEQTIEWVQTEGQFTSEKRKQQHLERCEAAVAKLDGSLA
jgi:hypothetical protein